MDGKERAQKYRDGEDNHPKKGEKTEEYQYYISSLGEYPELFSCVVRCHWSVESKHWHLNVTFWEDAHTTLDKTAVQYMFCTSTVYRRIDDNLKTCILKRHSCVSLGFLALYIAILNSL